MTIAVGAVVTPENIAASNGTPVSTSGSATTSASGSSFLIALRSFGDVYTTVTDNKSNTFTLQRKIQNTGDGDWLHIYLCSNGTGGAGHKPTLTVSSSLNVVYGLIELTGGAASILDAVSTGAFDSSSPFGDSVTSTNANDLILGFYGNNAAAGTIIFTPGAGFATVTAAQFTDGTSSLTLGVASQVVSSTGTYNPAFTVSSGSRGPAITLALKGAGGTGIVVLTSPHMRRRRLN